MFLPELGQTFAELDPEVKNQYSHRGRAARQLVALMQAQWA
jgi:XTP/dITP diphosphohydrolase